APRCSCAACGADLVAREGRFEKAATRESLFLGNGERAGNHVDRRMSAAQPIALVHLERDTGRRVAERGPEAICARGVPEQRRGRARGARGGELGKARGLDRKSVV